MTTTTTQDPDGPSPKERNAVPAHDPGGPSQEERSLAPKAEESRHTASRLTRSVRTASKAIRGNCRRARKDVARNEAARKRNGHTRGAKDELRQMNGESGD